MSELLNNPDFVIFLATLVTVAYEAYVIGELRDLWYLDDEHDNCNCTVREKVNSLARELGIEVD